MQGERNQIYLSMQFLQQNGAILVFGEDNKNSISLLIGVPVLAKTGLEIAPYMEVIVPGVLQVPVPHSSQGDCYPYGGSDTRDFQRLML